MKAIIRNKMNGVEVEVASTFEHPESHYGHAVWADGEGVAYFQVGFSGAPFYEIVRIWPTGKDDDTRYIIGQRIAILRRAQGLSQAKLAKLAGMEDSHIARIECGKYSVGLDTLDKIAAALGKRVDIV